MSDARRPHRPPLMSSTLVGSVILILGIVGVTLSYNANKGLPFVPTYDITVEVPDAARLVEAGSEVRVGSTRVGVVDRIEAVRGRGGAPPFARIRLALDDEQAGLPLDSRVTVRPRSLLGAKYVALLPGRSRDTLPEGGTLPLRQAIPVVEVSDTFELFGKRSARALQDAVTELGTGVAGRGPQLNRTFAATAATLPSLQRVLRVLNADDTDLAGFFAGVDQLTAALAPRATTLRAFVDGAATTMTALDRAGGALPATITELAATERVGVPALRRLQPVLAQAADIVRELRPAGAILPRATRRIAASLRDTTPALGRVPDLRRPAEQTLAALDRVTRDGATGRALGRLTATVKTVDLVLDELLPAQRHCNLLGVWARNTGSIVSRGDDEGNWLSFLLMFGGEDQALQSAVPADDAHMNPYPRTDATECESGNEVFAPGTRSIGNPDGIQKGTDDTRPPAGVRERAAAAGLLEDGR